MKRQILKSFSNHVPLPINLSLCEMCSNTEFFLVCIFPCSPNAGKYGPEKTPYLDTFHVVYLPKNPFSLLTKYSVIISSLVVAVNYFCTFIDIGQDPKCTSKIIGID